MQAVIGLDGGSTSSKAVLIDPDGNLLCKAYQLSKGNPIADTKAILARLKAFVHDQGATLDILGFGATGYAADVLEESVRADVNIVETVAPYDGGSSVLWRYRCDLRRGWSRHQSSVHGQWRHSQFSPLQPVLSRKRHVVASHGRSIRSAGNRVRGHGIWGAANPDLQLRLRRFSRC